MRTHAFGEEAVAFRVEVESVPDKQLGARLARGIKREVGNIDKFHPSVLVGEVGDQLIERVFAGCCGPAGGTVVPR